MNQPYLAYESQKAGHTVEFGLSTQVQWVSNVFNQFQNVANTITDGNLVQNALKAELEGFVDDLRMTSSTHEPFNAVAAQIGGFSAVLSVIKNDLLSLDAKQQLTETLVNHVGLSFGSIADGAKLFSTAVDSLPANFPHDLSSAGKAAEDVYGRASSFLKDLNSLGSKFSPQEIENVLSNGFSSILEGSLSPDLLLQNSDSVTGLMLNELTKIPTNGLATVDNAIKTGVAEFNTIKDTISNLASTDISSVISTFSSNVGEKISQGFTTAVSSANVANIGAFASIVIDATGFGNTKTGLIIKDVIQIGTQLAILACDEIEIR